MSFFSSRTAASFLATPPVKVVYADVDFIENALNGVDRGLVAGRQPRRERDALVALPDYVLQRDR